MQDNIKHERTFNYRQERNLKWYRHVIIVNNLSTSILQGTTLGKRRRNGRQTEWAHNVTEWSRRSFTETQALARN